MLHEDERSLYVHGGCDELMMAGVAGEAAIADAAHAAPLLHRRERARHRSEGLASEASPNGLLTALQIDEPRAREDVP